MIVVMKAVKIYAFQMDLISFWVMKVALTCFMQVCNELHSAK